MDKIQSKGIKSIRSRVANITEFLNEEMTTEEFRQLLLETIFEGETEIPTYELTENDWKRSTNFLKNVTKIGIGTTENHRSSTYNIHTASQLDKLMFVLK